MMIGEAVLLRLDVCHRLQIGDMEMIGRPPEPELDDIADQ